MKRHQPEKSGEWSCEVKIGEAIRYFERELEKIEKAEAIEASAAEPDEELLHAWSYEREATDMALAALRVIHARLVCLGIDG